MATFLAAAAVITAAGYVAATSGVIIADRTGISQSVVGAYLTAVSTSAQNW